MSNLSGAKESFTTWEEIAGPLENTLQKTHPISRRTLILASVLTAAGMKLAFNKGTSIALAQEEFTPGMSDIGPRNIPNKSEIDDEYALVIDPEARDRLRRTVMNPGSLRQIADRIVDIGKDFRAEGYLFRERPLNSPDRYGFKLAVGSIRIPDFLVTTRPFTEDEIMNVNLVAFSWKDRKLRGEEVYGIDYQHKPIDLKPSITAFPR